MGPSPAASPAGFNFLSIVHSRTFHSTFQIFFSYLSDSQIVPELRKYPMKRIGQGFSLLNFLLCYFSSACQLSKPYWLLFPQQRLLRGLRLICNLCWELANIQSYNEVNLRQTPLINLILQSTVFPFGTLIQKKLVIIQVQGSIIWEKARHFTSPILILLHELSYGR